MKKNLRFYFLAFILLLTTTVSCRSDDDDQPTPPPVVKIPTPAPIRVTPTADPTPISPEQPAEIQAILDQAIAASPLTRHTSGTVVYTRLTGTSRTPPIDLLPSDPFHLPLKEQWLSESTTEIWTEIGPSGTFLRSIERLWLGEQIRHEARTERDRATFFDWHTGLFSSRAFEEEDLPWRSWEVEQVDWFAQHGELAFAPEAINETRESIRLYAPSQGRIILNGVSEEQAIRNGHTPFTAGLGNTAIFFSRLELDPETGRVIGTSEVAELENGDHIVVGTQTLEEERATTDSADTLFTRLPEAEPVNGPQRFQFRDKVRPVNPPSAAGLQPYTLVPLLQLDPQRWQITSAQMTNRPAYYTEELARERSLPPIGTERLVPEMVFSQQNGESGVVTLVQGPRDLLTNQLQDLPPTWQTAEQTDFGWVMGDEAGKRWIAVVADESRLTYLFMDDGDRERLMGTIADLIPLEAQTSRPTQAELFERIEQSGREIRFFPIPEGSALKIRIHSWYRTPPFSVNPPDPYTRPLIHLIAANVHDERIFTKPFNRSSISLSRPDIGTLPLFELEVTDDTLRYFESLDGNLAKIELNQPPEGLPFELEHRPNQDQDQVIGTGFVNDRLTWLVASPPTPVDRFLTDIYVPPTTFPQAYLSDLPIDEVQLISQYDQESGQWVGEYQVGYIGSRQVLLSESFLRHEDLIPINEIRSIDWEGREQKAAEQARTIVIRSDESNLTQAAAQFGVPLLSGPAEGFKFGSRSLLPKSESLIVNGPRELNQLLFNPGLIGIETIGVNTIHRTVSLSPSLTLAQAPAELVVPTLNQHYPVWLESEPISLLVVDRPVDAWIVRAGFENPDRLGLMFEWGELFVYLETSGLTEDELIEAATQLEIAAR